MFIIIIIIIILVVVITTIVHSHKRPIARGRRATEAQYRWLKSRAGGGGVFTALLEGHEAEETPSEQCATIIMQASDQVRRPPVSSAPPSSCRLAIR
jgi:hypothetical protein